MKHTDTVVATVHGSPVPLSEIDALLDRVRSSRFSALLPPESGAMGRQLRRWLVQLRTSAALVDLYADTHGVRPTSPVRLDRSATIELGTMPTALLRMFPRASAVYDHVTTAAAALASTEVDLRAHFDRNVVEFDRPERRLLCSSTGGDWSEPVWTRTSDLSAVHRTVVAATPVGEVTDAVDFAGGVLSYRTLEISPARPAVLEEVREVIANRLEGPARRQAFVAWLERERHAHVVLMPGFEHPADPAQPDNTHRH